MANLLASSPPSDGLAAAGRVHLLDLRGLLFQSRRQVINLFLLRFHFAVRLQKFVEQHRVDHFVVNTLGLPARIMRHQSGIDSAPSAIRPNAGD